MDPCPFVRILVGDLVLKSSAEPRLSSPSSPSSSSTSSSCFCKIKLKGFPEQFSAVNGGENGNHSVAACFSLNRAQIDGFADKQPRLKISVYSGKSPVGACGITGGKLVGKVYVALDLRIAETRPCVFQQGWISIGDRRRTNRVSSLTEPPSPQLHLVVRAEPDPRFVFLFDGEPECSPQVFQVQGNVKQPVFTCKFGFRINSDLKNSSMSESSGSRNWMILRKKTKDNTSRERKGWSITIHDLSGSPVAVASMVTPFVASPGSDRVSRANPGAWLILRPGEGTWKPWGRLEAWREKSDSVGYKFDLLSESSSAAAATLASDAVSSAAGGKFTIDSTTSSSSSSSPMHSTHSSLDFGSGSRPGSRPGSGSGSDFGFGSGPLASRGFVMSSTVEGAGKSSRPVVEVGVQHVTCSEDAAAFVAVAAAMNLSMDACRLFSKKLPKELRN